MLTVSTAHADIAGGVMYSRDTIAIERKIVPQPPPPLPWIHTAPALAENPTIAFDVEVQDANAFYRQQGWYNLSDLPDNKGVFIVFPTPVLAPIRHSTQYEALDIVLADHEGTITQIVPNIRLSELDQEIVPAKPIVAMLLLKGQTCAAKSINPGDKINYTIFKRPPVVENAPLIVLPSNNNAVQRF